MKEPQLNKHLSILQTSCKYASNPLRNLPQWTKGQSDILYQLSIQTIGKVSTHFEVAERNDTHVNHPPKIFQMLQIWIFWRSFLIVNNFHLHLLFVDGNKIVDSVWFVYMVSINQAYCEHTKPGWGRLLGIIGLLLTYNRCRIYICVFISDKLCFHIG